MKRKISPVVAALLAAALLLGGCASAAPDGETNAPLTEAPVTQETEKMTAEPFTIAPPTEGQASDYVSPVVTEFEQTLDEIVQPGSTAEVLQQKFNDVYGEKHNDDGTFVLDQGDMYSWTFAYWVSGDVLSVVLRDATPYGIEDRVGFDIGDYYYVYTLHLSDGTPATAEEILKLAGVTEEEFRQRVMVAAGDAFCTFMPDEVMEHYLSLDIESLEFLMQAFLDSISEEFVQRATPYLDDEGKLWFSADVRHIAGAGSHMVLRPYEQSGELSPYYEQVLALAQSSAEG